MNISFISAFPVWILALTASESEIVLGLLLSSVGDISLAFTHRSPLAFPLGLVSFLIAHLFYLNNFFSKRDPSQSMLFSFQLWFSLTVGGFLMSKLLPFVQVHHEGKDLVIPVCIYCTAVR
jgi:uncharacterized membrane protein YhhN